MNVFSVIADVNSQSNALKRILSWHKLSDYIRSMIFFFDEIFHVLLVLHTKIFRKISLKADLNLSWFHATSHIVGSCDVSVNFSMKHILWIYFFQNKTRLTNRVEMNKGNNDRFYSRTQTRPRKKNNKWNC